MKVFSIYERMIRVGLWLAKELGSVLHMRGDDPTRTGKIFSDRLCLPYTWGDVLHILKRLFP
jgi:hypothetical protein